MSVVVVQETGSLGKPKQGDAAFGDEQFVVFNLGEEQFGVNITKVQEIIRWQKVTKVANAPEYVEG
ncbi:MAG: chemotaxis protein CheW, partial [Dehalococcoidia bacterium]|nr:chemotaxis protein CheW [Dehalococcoidia bacterium]